MDEKRYSTRDLLQTILGDVQPNGLPAFTAQDVPTSNVAAPSNFAQSQLGQAISNIPTDDRTPSQRMEDFKRSNVPENAQKVDSQNRMQIPSDDIIGGNPISSILNSLPKSPASVSGQAPLTPEQLQSGDIAPIAQNVPSAPAYKEEVPVTRRPASNSAVKEAFQNTQSPKQEAAAPVTVDAQNPLIDSEMSKAQAQVEANRKEHAFRSNMSDILSGLVNMGGASIKQDTRSLDERKANIDNPFTDLNTKREQEKKFLSAKEEKESQDPNSKISAEYRRFAGMLDMEVDPQASASSLAKLTPLIEKFQDRKMQIQSREDLAREGAANRAAMRENALGSRRDVTETKDAEAFRKAYDPQLASSRSVLGKEASRYVQSQHAMNLIKDVGDLSEITPMQKRELAVALATMLSPGIPHESTIHALDEKTLNGELASMVQKVTGAPASTNTKGLTQQLKTSVQNQQKVSAANIRKSQDAIKATFGKQIQNNPELYNQVIKSIDIASDDVQPSEHQNKPKTVVQNGHTFTLNESTGEYE